MTAQTGELMTAPAQSLGNQDSYGQVRVIALAGSGVNPIPHYALACYDNTNTRHYWVDTSISTANAPGGFTYVTSTLVVEGKF